MISQPLLTHKQLRGLDPARDMTKRQRRNKTRHEEDVFSPFHPPGTKLRKAKNGKYYCFTKSQSLAVNRRKVPKFDVLCDPQSLTNPKSLNCWKCMHFDLYKRMLLADQYLINRHGDVCRRNQCTDRHGRRITIYCCEIGRCQITRLCPYCVELNNTINPRRKIKIDKKTDRKEGKAVEGKTEDEPVPKVKETKKKQVRSAKESRESVKPVVERTSVEKSVLSKPVLITSNKPPRMKSAEVTSRNQSVCWKHVEKITDSRTVVQPVDDSNSRTVAGIATEKIVKSELDSENMTMESVRRTENKPFVLDPVEGVKDEPLDTVGESIQKTVVIKPVSDTLKTSVLKRKIARKNSLDSPDIAKVPLPDPVFANQINTTTRTPSPDYSSSDADWPPIDLAARFDLVKEWLDSVDTESDDPLDANNNKLNREGPECSDAESEVLALLYGSSVASIESRRSPALSLRSPLNNLCCAVRRSVCSTPILHPGRFPNFFRDEQPLRLSRSLPTTPMTRDQNCPLSVGEKRRPKSETVKGEKRVFEESPIPSWVTEMPKVDFIKREPSIVEDDTRKRKEAPNDNQGKANCIADSSDDETEPETTTTHVRKYVIKAVMPVHFINDDYFKFGQIGTEGWLRGALIREQTVLPKTVASTPQVGQLDPHFATPSLQTERLLRRKLFQTPP